MEQLALHEFHLGLGARFAEVSDWEAVDHYGNPQAEHDALRSAAGVMDLSFRSRLCLTGADRVRFLNGQVTNNVKDLGAGQGCFAALVTAKGRLQSDLNIYNLPNELLLDFEPGLGMAVSQRLEKYIIADDVQIIDAAPHYGLLSVQGPKALAVVETLGLSLELPARSGSTPAIPVPPGTDGESGMQKLASSPRPSPPSDGGEGEDAKAAGGILIPVRPMCFVIAIDPALGEIYLMHQARLGGSGFDLFAPVNSLGAILEKLISAARKVGGGLVGWQAWETARMEAGIPRFGLDMDETNLAPEAGLDGRAISYAKGCYIGQEVIARIRTYGQVAKALRRLRLADDLNTLPLRGDKLFYDGKEAGYVTSALASRALKANLAFGYVRKEVNQPGAGLTLRTAAGERRAVVVGLPFEPFS